MGVASRCSRLRVTQQFSDNGEPKARSRPNGSKGMSKIMNPDTLKACMPLNCIPRLLEIRSWLISIRTWDDIAADAVYSAKDFQHWGTHHDCLSAALAIRQKH